MYEIPSKSNPAQIDKQTDMFPKMGFSCFRAISKCKGATYNSLWLKGAG